MQPDKTAIDAEFVIHRLADAGRTYLARPEAALRRGPNGSAADIIKTVMDGEAWCQYRTTTRLPMAVSPNSSKLAQMDEAIQWVTLIPKERHVLRRIVMARAMVNPMTGRNLWSWRQLGRVLGCDYKSVQCWHNQGIGYIVTALRAGSPELARAA